MGVSAMRVARGRESAWMASLGRTDFMVMSTRTEPCFRVLRLRLRAPRRETRSTATKSEAQHAKLERRPKRTPRPLSPNQDERHRQEVRADDLHSRLVRAGRGEALSSSRAGLGDAVVQERAQKPADSHRCARRGRGVPGNANYRSQGCELCGREISREVRS